MGDRMRYEILETDVGQGAGAVGERHQKTFHPVRL